jgi:glycosyltransferase involved in cell wall biosynthesis
MTPTQQQAIFHYSLSIFFPAYNDAPSLPGLIATSFELASRFTDDFEVIIVNDGSTDNTAEVLRDLRTKYGQRLQVVNHEKNRGYGGALRSGFAAARKEYVFYTDGDGQYDVSELSQLLHEAAQGASWVNGYKRLRADAIHRVVIGAIYREFVRALFRLRLRDVDCDFRLIRRQAVEALNLQSTSGTICVELVWGLESQGLRAVEVGVTHKPRLHGKSQFFRLAPLWKTFRELGRLVKLRLSGKPLAK